MDGRIVSRYWGLKSPERKYQSGAGQTENRRSLSRTGRHIAAPGNRAIPNRPILASGSQDPGLDSHSGELPGLTSPADAGGCAHASPPPCAAAFAVRAGAATPVPEPDPRVCHASSPIAEHGMTECCWPPLPASRLWSLCRREAKRTSSLPDQSCFSWLSPVELSPIVALSRGNTPHFLSHRRPASAKARQHNSLGQHPGCYGVDRWPGRATRQSNSWHHLTSAPAKPIGFDDISWQ